MKTYTFDLESNGLRDEASHLWCVSAQDMDTGEMHSFDWSKKNCDDGVELIMSADHLIGQNIIGFDLMLIKDLYGVKFQGKVTDTLVLSKLLNHYRRRPSKCPTHYEVMGKDGKVRRKPIGPHSLQAWAVRLGGEQKIAQQSWYEWDPNMAARCDSDVRLTIKVLEALRGEL